LFLHEQEQANLAKSNPADKDFDKARALINADQPIKRKSSSVKDVHLFYNDGINKDVNNRASQSQDVNLKFSAVKKSDSNKVVIDQIHSSSSRKGLVSSKKKSDSFKSESDCFSSEFGNDLDKEGA